MSKLTIDLENVVKLASDGKTFALNPDAEESIVKLLELQEKVEHAISVVKASIAEQGTNLNQGFSGVRGSRIQASYRNYGQVYSFEHSDASGVDPSYYTKSITYRPNTKSIEDYQDSHGALPPGIVLNEGRKKSVSIKVL